MAEEIKYNDDLRTGTDKLNTSIRNANKAKDDSKEALIKAIESMNLSERTQKELTEAILEGDSSPLAGQLKVGADGKVYDGPQERLIAENQKLTEQLADIVINAKEFGLSEQNEDNSEKINNAIDYVASQGKGTVFIPDGSYDYKKDIHIKRGVTVLGGGNTTLKCGVDSDAKVIFYKETTLKSFRFKFPETFNDVAFEFHNEYMSPYDEGGVKPDTSNVQVDVSNVRIDKPFNLGTNNAVAIRLMSTGRHGNEIYSGFWGVNLYNVKIFGFNLVTLIKTENNGWVNSCKFDKIVADHFVNFMKIERSQDDLGVDFNVVEDSVLQAREHTQDMFIEDDNKRSTTIIDGVSFYDMKHNDFASIGNVENIRNIRDFSYLPVSRYTDYIRGNSYYLLGRFSIEGDGRNVTMSIFDGSSEVKYTIYGSGKLSKHLTGEHNSRLLGVDFFYREINGVKEIYMKADSDIYYPLYIVGIFGFSISSRERFDIVDNLTKIEEISVFGVFQKALFAINNEHIVSDSDRIVKYDREIYNYGDSIALHDGRISFRSSVKRVRISLSLATKNIPESNGRIRVRILKNGSNNYRGAGEVYDYVYGENETRVIQLTTATIRINEGDYFDVEVTDNLGGVTISENEKTWLNVEVIE